MKSSQLQFLATDILSALFGAEKELFSCLSGGLQAEHGYFAVLHIKALGYQVVLINKPTVHWGTLEQRLYVSHSSCSFTHFQGSELLQREIICGFFLAFSVATLTGLQRGNLPVATILLRNKEIRPGVLCRVQRMPLFIKWNPKKNLSCKSLLLSDIHKW